jgi:hypothetical protein
VIEQYDGTGWHIVSSPNVGELINVLNGVSCMSAMDCWAVGYASATVNSGSASQTLVEHYDGSGWAIVRSPNVSTDATDAAPINQLNGLTCISANLCVAVGDYTSQGVHQSLVEKYNGSAWSLENSPNSSGSASYLYRVSCIGASDCWAVGYGSTATLVEHFDGSAWSIVDTPHPGNASYLFGVSCVSAVGCTAVGYYSGSGNQSTALFEHYNGGAWVTIT